MKVIVPGHVYHTDLYDLPPDGMAPVIWIGFMRRVGSRYPGNVDTSPGTNCQEVLRVLIDRCKYLNEQQPCFQTETIIYMLRTALWMFESRAKAVKGKKLHPLAAKHIGVIEALPTCSTCGHILCEENHQHAK